jgi:two-component system, OmpR family, sensor histidine kinase CpxA
MRARPYFPLLAQVLCWLFLHLVILALAFTGFVAWQLGLGLDSLLSGSAGERLRTFGEAVSQEISELPPRQWNDAVQPLAKRKKVRAAIFDSENPATFPFQVPLNVLSRTRARPPQSSSPPPRRPPPFDELEDGRPRDDFRDRPHPPRHAPEPLATSLPVFLVRGENGDGYWAGVQLVLPGPLNEPLRRPLLLIRADGLDGSGMFFEFRPWLLGGLAVLLLSLAFWTPFVWRITHYIRRLTSATDRVAAGQFKISLPSRGNDELGNLGDAIDAMASRLDHLVSGQKRFLGDAAHELCAPLARLRTGLGILEMKLGDAETTRLAAIESDAQELATLVEEILAFSRAGHRTPLPQLLMLEPLLLEVIAREAGEPPLEMNLPPGLAAVVDPTLLSRALGNLMRNARIHAGPEAQIRIDAVDHVDFVEITVMDDGPGVSPDELARLFEPFYRPDRSRSRDTGGSGLGLAIVRTAIEACGGETTASLPLGGGFAVTVRLKKNSSLFDG